jgi:DNA-binding CsgD family transcriptional regulator
MEGLSDEAKEAWHRLFLRTPATDPTCWPSEGRRIARVEDLLPDTDPDDHPYVTDVLQASGLRYEVQLSCASGGRAWGHATFRRARADGPFGGREMRFLEALVPHLGAGLRAASAREALQASPTSGPGVIALGSDGRIEFVSGVAERLLSRLTAKEYRRSVTACSAVDLVAAMLARSLQEDGLPLVPEISVVDPESGEAYRLRAERVTGTDGLPRGVVFVEPSGPPQGAETLRNVGLSEREAEVALAVMRGQSTAQIATIMSISANTVHDHIRNVFAKLEVRSRQELAARFLGAA